MNEARRILEHRGCPTLESLVEEGRRQRSSHCMQLDALNSILRVLEPLEPEARDRCLAAARCVFNAAAAHEALDSLALDPFGRGRG